MVRKSFNEKLNDSRDMPKISILEDPKAIQRYKGRKLLIAAPIEYDEVMKKIPEGQLTTSVAIREYLARKHQADNTCPLTAGIFINIVAHASVEREGESITPYWRTLKKDGELNPKYPGGIEDQLIELESEGHKIIKKGKRYFVENYQDKLFKLDKKVHNI